MSKLKIYNFVYKSAGVNYESNQIEACFSGVLLGNLYVFGEGAYG